MNMTKEAPRNTRKSAAKPANRRAGETAPAAPVAPKPASSRAERAAERREAIIEAAMDEFIARGFAATRLDDVAKRAGVAKGTIYLHFKDKESMFEELIRTAIVPLVNRLAAAAARRRIGARHDRGVCPHLHPGGGDDAARRHRAPDRRRGTAFSGDRRLLLPRSGLAGPRRHARADRARASRAAKSSSKDLAQFPQILVAPAMIAVIWQSLFEQTRAAGRASRCFASISI